MPRTPAPPRILTCGYDAVLLDTRRLLLRQAGYQVDVVANPQEFEEAFARDEAAYKLFIICHTVPQDEQTAIAGLTGHSTAAVYQVPALVPPTDFLAHVATLMS